MQKFKPDDKIALKVYENRPIDRCEHIFTNQKKAKSNTQ